MTDDFLVCRKVEVLRRVGRRNVYDVELYFGGWEAASGELVSRVLLDIAAQPLADKLGLPCFGMMTSVFVIAAGNENDAVDLLFECIEGRSLRSATGETHDCPRNPLRNQLLRAAELPALFWSAKSISYIWAFLAGWRDATSSDADIELLEKIDETLRASLRRRLEPLGKSNWRVGLLFACAGNEEHACERFHEILAPILSDDKL